MVFFWAIIRSSTPIGVMGVARVRCWLLLFHDTPQSLVPRIEAPTVQYELRLTFLAITVHTLIPFARKRNTDIHQARSHTLPRGSRITIITTVTSTASIIIIITIILIVINNFIVVIILVILILFIAIIIIKRIGAPNP